MSLCSPPHRPTGRDMGRPPDSHRRSDYQEDDCSDYQEDDCSDYQEDDCSDCPEDDCSDYPEDDCKSPHNPCLYAMSRRRSSSG
jgi:hypothetical protein